MGYEEFQTPAEPDDPGERDDAMVPTPESLGIDLPGDPEAAVAALAHAVHEARAEADAYLDDLRRVAADFENFRRRATRDQQALVARASERVVSAMLPVLDSFDAALATETTTDADQKLLDGMRRTRAQLVDVLSKEGLDWIDAAPGTGFDPEVHEAVMTTGGSGELVIDRELRRGYRLGGHLLRAALVSLAEAGER